MRWENTAHYADCFRPVGILYFAFKTGLTLLVLTNSGNDDVRVEIIAADSQQGKKDLGPRAPYWRICFYCSRQRWRD